MIETTADHSYGGLLNTIVEGDVDTLVSGAVNHTTGGEHNLKAASFDFQAPGNINYQCSNLISTCVKQETNVLGPTSRVRLGFTYATAVGGANETLFGTRSTLTCGAQMRTDVGMTMVNRIGLEVYQVFGAVVNIKQGTTINLLGNSSVTNCPVNAEFAVLKSICGGTTTAMANAGIVGGRVAQAVAYGGTARNAIAMFFQVSMPILAALTSKHKVEEAIEDLADYESHRLINDGDTGADATQINDAQAKSYTHPELGRSALTFENFMKSFLGDDVDNRFDDPFEDSTKAAMKEYKENISKELDTKRADIEPLPEPPGGWEKPPSVEPSAPAPKKEPAPEKNKEDKDYKLSQQEGGAGKPGDKPPEAQWPTEQQDQWPKQQDNGGNSPAEDPNPKTQG